MHDKEKEQTEKDHKALLDKLAKAISKSKEVKSKVQL